MANDQMTIRRNLNKWNWMKLVGLNAVINSWPEPQKREALPWAVQLQLQTPPEGRRLSGGSERCKNV